MMFNVPLPGGATGHAVGGTLVAILLGPYSAVISLTVALVLQALLFGDGGVLALGANVFNMAIVLPFVGYFIYRLISNLMRSQKGEYIGAVVGSYAGINISALLAAIEFGIQPLLFKNAAGQPLYCPIGLDVSIPAMVIPHLLIAGVVEALFTVFIYIFIKKVSPGTIYEGKKKRSRAVYGLIAALVCATPLGLLAAGTAWGEWSAEEIKTVFSGGYTPQGMQNGFSFNSLLPDYSLHGLPPAAGYILSAVLGVAVTVIVFKLLGAMKKERSTCRNG
jgi:cobalt/nickel transport system permease protein